MEYHILYDFGTCTPFIEKSSEHSKGLYKLKLLTNVNINLTYFLGGNMNCVLNV